MKLKDTPSIPVAKVSHNKVTIRPNGSKRIQTAIHDRPITQQQFKDECDINKIMEKYQRTGQITHLARNQGIYADLTSLGDYQQSLQKVIDAENAFDTLPAKVRERFGNDPAGLLTFLADPQNKEEAIKLGLIEKPKKAPTPTNEPNEPTPPEPKSKT